MRSTVLRFGSVLAILVMYAFNDLYDAPVDWNNPKKDRALIATWIEHRYAGVLTTFCAGIERHAEDLKDGDLFLLTVYGSGFTGGSALLRWIDRRDRGD